METVKEIQKRHQEEVNTFEGLFFAFSDSQLAEGLIRVGLAADDYKAIVSIGAGGYLRKDRREAFHAMFERQAKERKEARRMMKTIKIKYVGIDSWNRPVFRGVDDKMLFFGSCTTLFNDGATEAEVLAKIGEDDLVYFGDYFGCEPMGSASGNIEIVREAVTA